jgi:hypothetical protein
MNKKMTMESQINSADLRLNAVKYSGKIAIE